MHNHVAGPNNDVLRNRQSKKDRDPWSFFFFVYLFVLRSCALLSGFISLRIQAVDGLF